MLSLFLAEVRSRSFHWRLSKDASIISIPMLSSLSLDTFLTSTDKFMFSKTVPSIVLKLRRGVTVSSTASYNINCKILQIHKLTVVIIEYYVYKLIFRILFAVKCS